MGCRKQTPSPWMISPSNGLASPSPREKVPRSGYKMRCLSLSPLSLPSSSPREHSTLRPLQPPLRLYRGPKEALKLRTWETISCSLLLTGKQRLILSLQTPHGDLTNTWWFCKNMMGLVKLRTWTSIAPRSGFSYTVFQWSLWLQWWQKHYVNPLGRFWNYQTQRLKSVEVLCEFGLWSIFHSHFAVGGWLHLMIVENSVSPSNMRDYLTFATGVDVSHTMTETVIVGLRAKDHLLMQTRNIGHDWKLHHGLELIIL